MPEPRSTFAFRCTSCPYAKNFGAAQLQAEIKAGTHARLNDHKVELRVTSTYHIIDHENQITLAEALDEPPF